jgi:hypothetical protein
MATRGAIDKANLHSIAAIVVQTHRCSDAMKFVFLLCIAAAGAEPGGCFHGTQTCTRVDKQRGVVCCGSSRLFDWNNIVGAPLNQTRMQCRSLNSGDDPVDFGGSVGLKQLGLLPVAAPMSDTPSFDVSA